MRCILKPVNMDVFLLSGSMIDKCAAVAERLTVPRTDTEAYEVKPDQEFRPIVSKNSSEGAVLEHTVSIGTIGFMIFFVCGVSGISVILSFVKISNLEPKKLLQLM